MLRVVPEISKCLLLGEALFVGMNFPVTVLFEDISTAFHRIMSPAWHFSHKSPAFSLNVPMSPLYLTRFTQCIRENVVPPHSRFQMHRCALGFWAEPACCSLVPGAPGMSLGATRQVCSADQSGCSTVPPSSSSHTVVAVLLTRLGLYYVCVLRHAFEN